ncbi:MAG: ATP-binding protein, partial [Armatimonadota bacterium]
IFFERKQYLIVSIADVTALKQSENALREANERLAHRTAQLETTVLQLQAEVMNRRRLEEELQAILQSVRCRIWHANVTMISSERKIDFAWELRDFNEAAAQRVFPVQVKHGQTYNDAFREHIPEEDKMQMDKTSYSALQSGQSMYSQNFRWIGDDGRVRWLYEDVFIKAIGPDMWHLVGVCTDITEQKLIEEERSKLALAVESTTEAIVITDASWNVAYANPAFENITGLDKQNIIGRHVTELNLDEKALKTAVEKAQQLKTWSGRMLGSKTDGSRYHANVNLSPIYGNDGKLAGYMLLIRDISEEVILQQQLEQAQKMEAIGRLAGGVAHDFNNILTAIGGFADILASKLDRGNPHRKYVEHIQNSVDKASALTKQLLAFSRKQVVEPKPLRINDVIAEIEPMLRSIIGEDIMLTTILKEAVVTVDPSQIEQVIMNLVVNSRDAMPQGGHLTIETAKVWLDEAYCQRHHDTTPGEYAMLAVTDTGCGISPDVLPHIFEPFFTTKEKGKGTGLGLSTVYGIVKQNGGSVWVYSEVGKGTTVKVYLPLAKTAPIAKQKQVEPVPVEVTGSETILLVEDEQTVRLLAHEILTDRGYTVLEAPNGEEAIQISESYEGEIDILVTDVIMPGMSGKEVAEHILRRRPKLKVLYMSGYTDNSIVHHGVLDSGVAYIQKPFTPDGLARKIREVLASPAKPASA